MRFRSSTNLKSKLVREMKICRLTLALFLPCVAACSGGGGGSSISVPQSVPQVAARDARNAAGTTTAAERVQPNIPGANPYSSFFSFNGTNGSEPLGTLVQANGVLYGTTFYGGTFGAGTVFSLPLPAGTVDDVLHSFNPGELFAGLINVNGELYGTASDGGQYGQGYVFKISTSGSKSDVYDFQGGPVDGANPKAALLNINGELYGTTLNGGTYLAGTVFKVSTSGSESVIHSFGGTSRGDGDGPWAPVVEVNGQLYGTTIAGGSAGGGTVFTITLSGAERVVHSFNINSGPVAGLTNVNGELYGSSTRGGPYNDGYLFKISTAGSESDIHDFEGGSDGSGPEGALLDVNGTLYGTTTGGGSYSGGTLFSVSTSGAKDVLHNFGSGTDGQAPVGGLIDLTEYSVEGYLYGTTGAGGTSGNGTIFSYCISECNVL